MCGSGYAAGSDACHHYSHMLAPAPILAIAAHLRVQKNIWTSNLNMSLNANGSLNFNGSASSPHQHIVGRSLQDANSHIAGLRSSGVTVRVHQPGQVTPSRPRILVCKLQS